MFIQYNYLEILQPFKSASIKNKNSSKRKIMKIYQTYYNKQTTHLFNSEI